MKCCNIFIASFIYYISFTNSFHKVFFLKTFCQSAQKRWQEGKAEKSLKWELKSFYQFTQMQQV